LIFCFDPADFALWPCPIGRQEKVKVANFLGFMAFLPPITPLAPRLLKPTQNGTAHPVDVWSNVSNYLNK
jgi:hypothetical protein